MGISLEGMEEIAGLCDWFWPCQTEPDFAPILAVVPTASAYYTACAKEPMWTALGIW